MQIRSNKGEKFPHSNITSCLNGLRNCLIALLLKLTFVPEWCIADVPPSLRRAWEKEHKNPTPVTEIFALVKLTKTTIKLADNVPLNGTESLGCVL